MTSLRHVHRLMNERQMVLLNDGRAGRIVRVDTKFPENDTVVSVWTGDDEGPGVAKVRLSSIVGPDKGTGKTQDAPFEDKRHTG